MSERESYPHGVPCWVEGLVPDPAQVHGFYEGLFGWEFVGPAAMPGEDETAAYWVARLEERDVAGLGTLPKDASPGWITHVRTRSADETAEAAERAGGRVLAPPFDVPPVGRMAVLADPAGAVFAAWQARHREGARAVNEPGAWAMSRLFTPDPDGAATFYGALFGWQVEPLREGVWVFRLPGYEGGEPWQPVPLDVVAALVEDPAAAGWDVELWTADVAAACAAAERLGGRLIEAPAPRQGAPLVSGRLADPGGAQFMISQVVEGDRS